LGWPKDAKGYTFTDPKDFEFSDTDKERRENFRGVAHRLNLSQRQLDGLYTWEVERAKLARDAERAGRDEGGKKSRAQLQKDWGSSFDERLKSAKSALKHYAGGQARELAQTRLANGGVLGDHPDFVAMMARIGSAAPAPRAAGSVEEAEAQIKAIRLAAERDGITPGTPRWAAVDAQLEPYYRQAYGDEPLDQSGAHNARRRAHHKD